jgi:cbb3-type cytochrome oxidase maturation protein
MEIIYLLIPIALILVAVVIWIFIWAVKSDQFEDLEGPAHKIIMDNDKTTNMKDESTE